MSETHGASADGGSDASSDLIARTSRQLASLCTLVMREQVAEATVRRRVKKLGLEYPVAVMAMVEHLRKLPPDQSRARGKQVRKEANPLSEIAAVGKVEPVAQPVDASPPTIMPMATPTLNELEDMLRKAKDGFEADRLSKMIRGVKVAQQIRIAEQRMVDVVKAKADIEIALTFFRTTLMAWPKSVVGTLVGMTALELEAALETKFTELLADLRRGLESAIQRNTPMADESGTDPGDDAPDETPPEPVG